MCLLRESSRCHRVALQEQPAINVPRAVRVFSGKNLNQIPFMDNLIFESKTRLSEWSETHLHHRFSVASAFVSSCCNLLWVLALIEKWTPLYILRHLC